MQIHLTARHCEIGVEIRAFAQQRLEKLSRYDGDIHDVRVIVTLERKLHTVEITLRVHHQDMVITESHAEPRAALELAADRLEERVRRSKEKRVSAPRREGRVDGAVPPAPQADDVVEDEG